MASPVNKEAYFETIKYEPHPKQLLFHNSNARFRVPCCGRRFGKSIMAARDLEPELFAPKRRFWCVGPTYDLGEKEFRVLWDDLIIGQKLGKDKRVKKAYNKRSGEMYIEFPWQTRVEVRSADHPEGLVGDSLHGVIMSEAAKHKVETWERYIRPALTDYHGWATFPTTPEGHNWLYTLWHLGQNPDLPDYESWRFPSWFNPHVFPQGRQDPELILIEKTTSPEWFMQEIGADFSSYVGKIFQEFDESTHVRPVAYNPAWPSYIAFDWGYVHPLAAIEFQIDPWDNIWVWREHYKSYTQLEEHLQILAARDQPEGYKLDCAFGDAADPGAADFVSRNMGVGCLALPEAKENWRAGIEVMKTFLRLYQVGIDDEYGTPKLEPKFFVDPKCVHFIQEMDSYRAPDKLTTASKEARSNSVAVKEDDHGIDAMRYALVSIYTLGAHKSHLSDIYTVSELESTAPSSGYFTSTMNF